MQRNINHLAGLRVDKYHNLKDSLFPRPGLVLTKPQTTRDYMALYQAAVLTWEILRYQRMKVGVLAAHQRRWSSCSATAAEC